MRPSDVKRIADKVALYAMQEHDNVMIYSVVNKKVTDLLNTQMLNDIRESAQSNLCEDR